MSLTVNITSAAVTGAPSDHFRPGRRWMVKVWKSSLMSRLSAMLAYMTVPLGAVMSYSPSFR